LEEEMTNCKLYLDIEKIRFGDKLMVEMEFSNKCMKAMIPNMILQPLLENAIKHGVYESLEPVIIKLKCELQNTVLQIIILNSFDNDSSKQKGNGIGLRNVKQRLFLTYGMPDLVKITDQHNTFRVELIIPQQNVDFEL
jgi:sensor histidine kinase YesM